MKIPGLPQAVKQAEARVFPRKGEWLTTQSYPRVHRPWQRVAAVSAALLAGLFLIGCQVSPRHSWSLRS